MSALWPSRDKAQEAEVETLFLSVFERDSDSETKSISLYFYPWANFALPSGAKTDKQTASRSNSKSGRCGSTNLISETEKKTSARDPGKKASQETDRPQSFAFYPQNAVFLQKTETCKRSKFSVIYLRVGSAKRFKNSPPVISVYGFCVMTRRFLWEVILFRLPSSVLISCMAAWLRSMWTDWDTFRIIFSKT